MAIRLSGLNSGMDTDAIVKELMSAHSLKLTKVENKKTKNTWTQDKWKELNTKIYALYTGELSTARLNSSYKTKKAISSGTDSVEATAGSNAAAGAHSIEVKQLASAQYVTGNKAAKPAESTTKLAGSDGLGIAEGTTLSVTGAGGKTASITVTDKTTVADVVSSFKSAGINANFDKTQNRFFLSSEKSGEDQGFSITASDATGAAGSQTSAALSALGLGVIDNGDLSTATSGITVIKAQDAKIVLDGAELSCSSNETEVNGIKLTLKQKTTSPVTVSVSNDTQGVYDMINGLIKSYNSVLGAMNTAYYANSAKGYDPLTDEEKEAMTDDQIEKWETKIQDSLLRRDSTLSSLLSTFKNTMSMSVTVDGKSYSLTSLGICTSKDYNEKGLLHIKGEKSDSTYSDQENTLMKMIEEDPEKVAKIVQGIASELYDKMGKKMSATSLSSALTFYNDKQMTKLNKEYDDDISEMKIKLATLEERYYKQFTAMETAMAKLNQQQSSLAGLLG